LKSDKLKNERAPSEVRKIYRYALICSLLWTALLAGLFAIYFDNNRQVVTEIGHSIAVASFEKDLLFRRWAARHGVVYVPETVETPANPYLAGMPERDITTPSGRRLTLVNPAYMSRQIFELAREQSDLIQGHITSRNPIRSENAPDAWEAKALEKLEQGTPEVAEQILVNGTPFMRFMRPLVTEKPCLRCHAAQGYKEKDVRGGISVTLSLTPIQNAMSRQVQRVAGIHVVVWLVGLAVLLYGTKKIVRTMSMLDNERTNLRESEERFQMLHDASFGGIVIHDQGCILDCNQGMSDITGFNRDELIGSQLYTVIAPGFRDLVAQQIADSYDKRYEAEGVRKDGSTYPLAINGKNIPYKGRSVRVAEFRDITERKQMEEELISNRSQLSTLIETLPDAVFMKDSQNRWLIVNNVGLKLFCLTDLPWQGKHELELKELQPAMSEAFQACYESDNKAWLAGHQLHNEEHIMTVDGQHRDYEVIKVPLFTTTGERKGLVVVARDITERKQAEEARQQLEMQFHHAQKLESLGVLAGGIAHDFNNILTMILGHCYLAKESCATVLEYKASFNQVEIAANRAADLCRQMLTYAGKSPLVQTRVNMWLLVDEVVKMLQSAIKKNVTINLDLTQRVPEIMGDTGQIQQIIMNLIINAAEAIGEKLGTINVALTKVVISAEEEKCDIFGVTIHEGVYACLEVSDTGGGMDADTQKRIFEPFFTTKFAGRGLGMSAIRGIIASHEGMLQLSSEPEFGTTFTAYFPVPDLMDIVEIEMDDDVLAGTVGGVVMLVDDEAMLRDMGKELLEALGFAAITAQNGREALDMFRERSNGIDLVLLDLIMPVMGGIDAYHELRSLAPTLPIIICSGYGVESVSEIIKNDPYAGFVHKPYKPAELRNVIGTMML
jgi:PAS domain S-box-containing protein